METIFEIVSVVIGRWILGGIGALTRRIWFSISTVFQDEEAKKEKRDEFNHIIDVEAFKNRIVGFLVVVGTIILLIYVFNL